MLTQLKEKKIRGIRRARHVRKRVRGTSQKPRLCVVKSNKHLFAQLIDDESGTTLGSISTLAKEVRGTEGATKGKAGARVLGEKIAEIAKAKQIEEVVFDRGRFAYHGILAELANAARSAGLQF